MYAVMNEASVLEGTDWPSVRTLKQERFCRATEVRPLRLPCGCIYNCRAVVLLQMSWSKCVTCLKLDSWWTGKILLPRKTFIWMNEYCFVTIVKGTEVLSTGRTFPWENGFNCHHYEKNPHGGSIRISWLWNASYKWFWQTMRRSIYNVWKIYIDFK